MDVYIDPNSNIDKKNKELCQTILNVANIIEKEYIKGKPRPSFIDIRNMKDNFKDIVEEEVKEFKYMKKTEGVPEGYIYVPWIPHTTKAFINGIQVWDCRWWKNIFCKINWFLHFKRRKSHKKYVNINTNFYYQNFYYQ